MIKNGKNHLEDIGSGWFAFANAHAYSTPTVTVYLTVKDTGQRLAKAGELSFQNLPQPAEGQETIFVDPTKKFQTALDIGGALTAAAAETFYKLPADRQWEILRAYFDPQKGIGYSLGRTQINSCDFSSESYTYVTNSDAALASFDISHDLKYRLPFIKEVLATVGKNNASGWGSTRRRGTEVENGKRICMVTAGSSKKTGQTPSVGRRGHYRLRSLKLCLTSDACVTETLPTPAQPRQMRKAPGRQRSRCCRTHKWWFRNR